MQKYLKLSLSDVSMSSTAADERNVIKMFAKFSESDVKNYRARFRRLIVSYSSLQFNESLGEG